MKKDGGRLVNRQLEIEVELDLREIMKYTNTKIQIMYHVQEEGVRIQRY